MEDIATVWFPAVHIFDDVLPLYNVEKRVLPAIIHKLRQTHSACQKIKWLNIPKYLARYFTHTRYKEWRGFHNLFPFHCRKINFTSLKIKYIYLSYTFIYIYMEAKLLYKGKYLVLKKRNKNNPVNCWERKMIGLVRILFACFLFHSG